MPIVIVAKSLVNASATLSNPKTPLLAKQLAVVSKLQQVIVRKGRILALQIHY
jgi:hypothetical protein